MIRVGASPTHYLGVPLEGSSQLYPLTLIGEPILARDEAGRLRSRIATVFPRAATLVTLPGIHATQRCAFTESLNRARAASGHSELTEEEEEVQWSLGVDLIVEESGVVLIRPDPDNMALAYEADDFLQQHGVSKRQIHFLHVRDPRVIDAIRRRGECWRITPLPRSPDEMKRMIAGSRIAISGREIYYYDKSSGGRFLTFSEFSALRPLPDDELRKHLIEIRDYCQLTNRAGKPEIDFFLSTDPGLPTAFAIPFEHLPPGEVRHTADSLLRRFSNSVPAELRRDDLDSPQWRARMFSALIGQTDQTISEEQLLGLAAEFFMQVEWLPGGRMEDGELILDSLFDEEMSDCSGNGHLCDDRARGFIFNFIRDFGDLEYVNIGRVVGSLSGRKGYSPGRRGVYVAEIKHRAASAPVLRIIRMQKWGVGEHLDEGKDLLRSILESEEYTEYILDRRMGCRQLGMNLPPRAFARKVSEKYGGHNRRFSGTPIWSAYFERDYVAGVATDKIPPGRLADPAYATALAHLLGRAAAPNLIVGRTDIAGKVIFDDGDELVIESSAGLPIDVVVADHTGTFGNYHSPLVELAPAYADCLNERLPHLTDPHSFALAFLAGFSQRLGHIRQEYDRRKRAFDTLFKHLRRDEGGSFAYRWECVLKRLQATDPGPVAERVRAAMKLT